MAEPAVRFRFEYGPAGVRLTSRQAVEMVVSPSDNLAGPGLGGFWFELRDANDRVLYRKIMHNPIRLEHEVFETPRHSPRRVRIEAPSDAFWLIAPALPNARSLVLYSSPLEPGRSHEAAEELARFDLAAPA